MNRVRANGPTHAEKKFLANIILNPSAEITVEIPERDVYLEKDAKPCTT